MWLTWAICTCTLHLHCIFLEEQIWGYISLGFNPICHGEIYIMFMLIHCTVLFIMSIKFYSILFYSIPSWGICKTPLTTVAWWLMVVFGEGMASHFTTCNVNDSGCFVLFCHKHICWNSDVLSHKKWDTIHQNSTWDTPHNQTSWILYDRTLLPLTGLRLS